MKCDIRDIWRVLNVKQSYQGLADDIMIRQVLEEVWMNKRIEYVRVECEIGIEMLEMIKGMVRDHLGVQN